MKSSVYKLSFKILGRQFDLTSIIILLQNPNLSICLKLKNHAGSRHGFLTVIGYVLECIGSIKQYSSW